MHTFSVALYLVLIYQLRNLIFIVMHFLPKIGLETACPIENFNRLSLHHRRRKRLVLPTIQCFQGFSALLRLRHRPIGEGFQVLIQLLNLAVNILGHLLHDAGTAHLHGHRSAVEEGGPVHLGDGGGP